MPHTPSHHTDITSLTGRRVLVTGGTTGIGRATAVLLASEGARVFVCGRDQGHLDDALARINEVGEGQGILIDLGDPDAPRQLFDRAEAALGGLDVAVINAAVPVNGLTEEDEEAIRYAVAVDFTAYLMCAKQASERLGAEGDIVFTGSMSAHVLGPHSTVYAGIKAGIAGFSEALRKELGPKGIRVAAVEPGKTKADFSPDESDRDQAEGVADEDTLRAEDIAVGVHYLLTQPRRTVVQQLTIVPRGSKGE